MTDGDDPGVTKVTPELTLTARPETLEGGGTVTLTLRGLPEGNEAYLTCSDTDVSVRKGADNTWTAVLPNRTASYTFTAFYAGDSDYNETSAACTVEVKEISAAPSRPSRPSGSSSSSSSSKPQKPAAADVPSAPDVPETPDTTPSRPNPVFTDITPGAWYQEAVAYAVHNGWINGYDDATFHPNDMLTRAQLAQILYNKEGRPGVNSRSNFVDVAAEAWYADAVDWAVAERAVTGYGDGRFGPNDSITREQLAVILWRYMGEPASAGQTLPFRDADQAHDWALEALRWATENGVLNGKGDGILDPRGTATRAEVAQMLMNFFEQ